MGRKGLLGKTHGASVGVSGLDGGSGISIRVGVAISMVGSVEIGLCWL
jgi:hypothetical protein